MSAIAKVLMQKFYRQAAGQPEKLPWHSDEPDALLRRAVDARAARGRALDVSCGAGVFTVWLAQSGMEIVLPTWIMAGFKRSKSTSVSTNSVVMRHASTISKVP